MARNLRLRGFFDSPLFQLFYNHFEDFQESYSREYESQFGFYRPIWDETLRRFLDCGDPRVGVARFDCERCQTSLFVPFSCKTRLFCPSCHQKKLELWVDDVMSNVIRQDIPHRFWTFSIPKRLRVYFKYRRKLLGLLVKAAKQTILTALTQGQSKPFEMPGMIILIQTQGDELNFNCHLHALITDGLVNYSDPKQVIYHPCYRWDFKQMTELFRLHVLNLMVKDKVISTDIANNMLSWPHSGFHVHASEPFTDAQRLERCLRYSFRAPVSLEQMHYDPRSQQVVYSTNKKKQLVLHARDFIASLCQHIPDRYQNMRRYAGCYAANVRSRLAEVTDSEQSGVIQQGERIKVSWPKLIARVFGEIPTKCPKCGDDMKLTDFIFQTNFLLANIKPLSRAPPRIIIEKHSNFSQPSLQKHLVLSLSKEHPDKDDFSFDQTPAPVSDEFDQRNSW